MSADRAALIEAAARAIHADVCCPCDATGCDEPDPVEQRDARLVLDAVLPLIADAIEAETCTNSQIHEFWLAGYESGTRDAARLVRSLGSGQ